MTQITDEQKQRIEAAATSVTPKLERFMEDLSPDERTVLMVVLRQAGAEAQAATGDVAGYRDMLQIAVDSARNHPMFDILARYGFPSVNWEQGFSGTTVNVPKT
jgi:hypothetical protein